MLLEDKIKAIEHQKRMEQINPKKNDVYNGSKCNKSPFEYSSK